MIGEAFKEAIWEDDSPTFLARLMVDASNTLTAIQQSDLSSITYAVYYRTTEIGSGTLTISSVVYNTLQTGTIWSRDSTGFNMKVSLSSNLFPTGNREYRVEFTFTLAGGSKFHLVYDIFARALRSS